VKFLGALPWPSSAGALDRLDSVHQFLEDVGVVDVGAGEHYREWDAPSVRNKVALRARFAPIRRILAGFLAPLLAGTLAESSEARSSSNYPSEILLHFAMNGFCDL
jgi:hypothetical protein